MGDFSLGAADLVIQVSKVAAVVIAGFGWAAVVMLVRVTIFIPTWKSLREFQAVFAMFIIAGYLALAWVLIKVVVMFIWRMWRGTTPPNAPKIADSGCVRLENTYICHRGDGGEVV